ncbi:MAG TPA: hypothetical protein VLT83_11770 [Opitutaceae bacterium]|nr:hypothetical protein [Opitutaceae bacterium]
MKNILAIIAALALAGVALAQVDPTRPMVTGHGNVSGRPGRVIPTYQTAKPGEVQLERFIVTGSLLKEPAAKAVRGK